MAKKFDIDNLLSQLNNRVIISGDNLSESRGDLLNAPGVTGIMTNDFSISVSNDFGSLMQQNAMLENISNTIGRAATTGAAVFDNDKLGEFVQGLAPRSLLHTVATWSGSSKPAFPISMLFLKLRSRDDIGRKVRSLYRTVLPSRAINLPVAGKAALSTIRAPLGYFPTSESTAQGTLALQIGQWFKATNLICRSVDFTFSKEVSTDGFPLYATGTIILEPFRMITYEEFEAYFINTGFSGAEE